MSPSALSETALRWQLLVIVALFGFLLWLLAPVLMPFAAAAALAYLGDPLADRLERAGLKRMWAATIVFVTIMLAVVGVLLLLIPFVLHQVERLLANLPRYGEWLQFTVWPWAQVHLHLDPEMFDPERVLATLKGNAGSIGGVATTLLGKLSSGGLGIAMWLTNLVLIPVVAFYLLRDWDVLVARLDALLPRAVQPTVAHLARESDRILGAFVRGQLLVMLALGVFYGTGLGIAGLGVGPLIGMVAGLLSFVPYLGFVIGFGAALVAALVQFGDAGHVLAVCGVFAVGQLLEGYVLTPKLVGDKIGLHPVAVMFAVLAGGYLFGFLGVLLALPAASVIMVVARYLAERYRLSELYRRTGAEDPVLRARADVARQAAAAAAAAPEADRPDPP